MRVTKGAKGSGASRNHRIICGLDFGTTFSGFAYGHTGSTGDVEIINIWPGTGDTVNKTPTRIAYPSENGRLGKKEWGFAVRPNQKSHTWFKLELDSVAKRSEFDDVEADAYSDPGLLRLPTGKSAPDLCLDYLRLMQRYVFAQLRKKYGVETFDACPRDIFITVPAIWSDAAKNATRQAALTAGFGARKQDTVSIIAEPEAAALAALKPHLDRNALDPIARGDVVLVCDCGGGTTDVTTYKIKSCHPKLQFDEIVIGVGGKCGSTFVDRNFLRLMEKRFGPAFTSTDVRKRSPGSSFMRDFEIAKRAFSYRNGGGQSRRQRIEIEGLGMKLESSEHYDADEEVVKLTWIDMKQLFDPVIERILSLLDSQLASLKRRDEKLSINRVILVGGFGESDYLNERVGMWCSSNKIANLTCPPQCQAAVVRGAVIRGLENLAPSTRLARRYYGYVICLPFRQGIDPESLAFNHPFCGQKLCLKRIEWVVRKGQVVSEHTKVRHRWSTHSEGDRDDDGLHDQLELVSCSADVAPEYANDGNAERVGTLEVCLSAHDMRHARCKIENGVYMREIDLTLGLRLSPKQGTLAVKTSCNGRVVGRTSINFDSS